MIAILILFYYNYKIIFICSYRCSIVLCTRLFSFSSRRTDSVGRPTTRNVPGRSELLARFSTLIPRLRVFLVHPRYSRSSSLSWIFSRFLSTEFGPLGGGNGGDAAAGILWYWYIPSVYAIFDVENISVGHWQRWWKLVMLLLLYYLCIYRYVFISIFVKSAQSKFRKLEWGKEIENSIYIYIHNLMVETRGRQKETKIQGCCTSLIICLRQENSWKITPLRSIIIRGLGVVLVFAVTTNNFLTTENAAHKHLTF